MTAELTFQLLTVEEKRQNQLPKQIYQIADAAYPAGSPWKVQAFRSELNRPDSQYLVARQGKQLVGFLAATQVLDQVDITNVAVLPNVQRQHVGTQLFQTWFATLEQGNQVFLEVRQSNQKAIGLYQSLGFARIGERKNYYRDPEEDAILMMKQV